MIGMVDDVNSVMTTTGVHDDIPDHVYRANGSLSCSEARRILECPAKYVWEKTHPVNKDVFDFGRAAHRAVLGVGDPVVVLPFADWRTKAAQEAREDVRAAAQTPMLAHDWAVVEAMAAALREHPIAARLLDPTRGGKAEQSLRWLDPASGLDLRARVDWLSPVPETGRMIVPDYKTTTDARPSSLARSVVNFGYHQQASWYLDGVRTLLGVEDPAFVFIAQEREPPHLVTVFELDADALRVGAERNRWAINRYLECRESGVWPGYSTDVALISLPTWALVQHDREQDTPW